jgi:type IV pilus assembly protein PilC
MMSKISNAQLYGLCGRVATSLEAGIDARRIWNREAEQARGGSAAVFSKIASSLSQGGSLAEAIEQDSQFFPPLFNQIVQIGEAAGKLPTVFRRLAQHYENRIRMRRLFLAGITWPAIQFVAAILIVGFLIWILGAIAETKGPAAYDILGLGLLGHKGLFIYTLFWFGVFTCGAILFFLIRNGLFYHASLERSLFRIPYIGHCIKTICLARFCWSLGLLLESGMDVRHVLPYAFRATGSSYFNEYRGQVSSSLQQGDELFVALLSTGIFPHDFLDTLQVGEQSGRIEESMLRLAEYYEDQARAAIATLTKLAGFVTWLIVAAMIIGIIVNMVAGYANFLQQLSGPR